MSAQQPVTVSEDQINRALRIEFAFERNVRNPQADLQPGQVVLTADISFRARGQTSRTDYAIEAVFVPVIDSRGRLTWEMQSAMANGEPASDSLSRIINVTVGYNWWDFAEENRVPRRVSSVEVTDTEIILQP
ncbi:MAG TPA: hypothetical protein VER79_04335 [Candidatus Limnocylindrales bacterium]|nr:hypothetical protein [Candidatus Limnocylindrales bacterium]